MADQIIWRPSAAFLKESNVRRFMERHGIADWRELVADDRVDVLVVCVPTQLHSEVAVAAMDAGRHVLCEKPMAPSPGQCRDMIQARDRNGQST